MKIIFPDGETRESNIDKILIRDLLDELDINPLEVVVAKNGRIVPEDEVTEVEDEIKIIRVVHGG